MAAKKRITKRQLKEDQFVTTAFQFADYFQHNRTQALLGLAGVIAVVLVAVLFVRFQVSSKRNAATMLSQGAGLFQTGVYDEAAFRLGNFLEAHPRHEKADYAALVCGDAYYYTGRFAEAAEKYEFSLERAEEGSEIWFGARAGQAAIAEASGQALEAADIYAALAARNENPAKKAHLQFSAIRCYREAKKYGRASELLARLDETKLDAIDQASLEWQKRDIEMSLGRGGPETR